MKTMTCKNLGGPCDLAFHGENPDDIIKAQDAHIREAVANGDESHKAALEAMDARWKDPVGGMGWYKQVQSDFAALPEEPALA